MSKDSEVVGFRHLSSSDRITQFECGDSDLNDFIMTDAPHYQQKMLAENYVLENEDSVLAYFSIMNDRIGVENFENKTAFNKFRRSLFVNAKRMRGYPAVKIGRLAVRKNDSRKGYGSIILDFIKMMLVSERTSACRFIVVDAYKDAIQFYEKNGFSILSAGESRSRTCLMYFDLMELRLPA